MRLESARHACMQLRLHNVHQVKHRKRAQIASKQFYECGSTHFTIGCADWEGIKIQADQVEEIIEDLLKDKAKIRKPDEIDAFLKPFKINNKTMIKLLEHLVDNYVFRWMDFICVKLPQLASEEEFIGLLAKIIRRVKSDWAQGPFIGTLIEIGQADPHLGISLHRQMIATNDEALISYSSFPLGGASRKCFDEAFSLVKEGLKSKDAHLREAAIKTLRVIFENETELKRESEIFGILNSLSSEKEDAIVQNEVLKAYIDFSRFRPDKCARHLLAFAKRKDPQIRYSLARTLWLRDLPNKEDEIRILEICAEDEDENVLSQVSSALSRKGQEFPERALKIIKNWIKRGMYSRVHEIEYPIREIGKVNLDRCIKEVETWIEEDNVRLQFFVPIVLTELSSSDYNRLVTYVKTWPPKDGRFWKMALRTIRAVLTEIFLPGVTQKGLIDSCFSILESMARERKVDVEVTIRGEPDKFFQCFRLIEEMELERKQLDFQMIFSNLKNYGGIHNFLGKQWFEKMAEENNRTHPLLILLSREQPSEEKLQKEVDALSKKTSDSAHYITWLRIEGMLWSLAFLKYLEERLQVIVSRSKKLKDLKNGLMDEDQFWATVSEVGVISSFIKDYTVEIAPKLDGKKLDVKVELEAKNLLIEVINPKRFKPLQYLTGKAIGIKNRARDKIFNEFKHHLQGMEVEDLVAIVIDIDRSEISCDSIVDYLIGTPQLTMLFDREKGRAVETFPSRAENYMHALEKGTDVLSAVICYKRYLGRDKRLHKEGRVILNPNAKRPLSSEVVEKVEEAMFT